MWRSWAGVVTWMPTLYCYSMKILTSFCFDQPFFALVCESGSATGYFVFIEDLVRNSPGELAGCGGPGLEWFDVVCGCVVGLTYCLMTLEEAAYGTEINTQFPGNSSGGHSCSQHASCTLPQNLRHLWHCVVWPNCTF
jgi:hypothetical protein